MSTSTRYHPGEVAAQNRAVLVEQAELSRGAIGAVLPPPAAAFLAEQPMLVLGAADVGGRMWSSLLTGPPGFARATGERTVEVGARPVAADPLAAALEHPAQVGMIAIEPQSRRRMRVNGRSEPTAGGLWVSVEQVYANCPKYIQKRSPRLAPGRLPVATGTSGTELTARQQQLVAAADTFFVATHSADGDADASHRGGNSGFVQVLGGTALRWPDYAGNAMMMTLGNLEQDSAAGLLFIDWDTGTTLQLTGTARVDWDPASAAQLPGAQRVVEFRLTRAVQVEHAGSLSWTAPGFSKFNPPAPGAPASRAESS